MPQFSNLTFEAMLDAVGMVWRNVWWIVLPLAAFFIFRDFLRHYLAFKLAAGNDWRLLEVKVSRTIAKSPKAMEQIFSALHIVKIKEGGAISCELVGGAGESHFYFRISKEFRNLVESSIYAQFPDAEITEIPEENDYLKTSPASLPDKTFDVFGCELLFGKPDAYPLRTYPQFEEKDEELRIDPIAALMETMSKLKSDEKMWVQIVIQPAGKAWKKAGEEVVNELMGKKEVKQKTPLFGISAKEALLAPIEHPSLEVKKEESRDKKSEQLSPGKRSVLEAVEEKLSKLGFTATIRICYIDSRENFSRSNVVAMLGAFRQFNTENLNALEVDRKTLPILEYALFKKWRIEWRKRLLYERCKAVAVRTKAPVLNTEELATLYHFPSSVVLAPSLARVEAKKGGAPANLPLAE